MALLHGGDIVGYEQTYGRQPVDLSANINPCGLPAGVREAAIRALDTADRYPDPLCRELTAAIAEKEGLPGDRVLCLNGAADGIFRLAAALRPRRALIPAPTFAEYALALGTVGCRIDHHVLREEEDFLLTSRLTAELSPDVDMLFLCNPNNPTGHPIDARLLTDVLVRCRETGTVAVVDECFLDFLPDGPGRSLTPQLDAFPNLVLLKAFTKLYAMAGLRLGYLLAAPETVERLRAAGQPWAVSGVAQAAGIAALAETGYVAQSLDGIALERRRLLALLGEYGVRVIGSQANFLFFKAPADGFVRKLAERGVLLRDCDNFACMPPGYCRMAVKDRDATDAFFAALDALYKEEPWPVSC